MKVRRALHPLPRDNPNKSATGIFGGKIINGQENEN